MKHSVATVIVLLVAVAVPAACGGSGGSDAATPQPAATTPSAGDTGTPAAIDGATVFADNCAGCHGSDGGGGRGPDISAQTDAQHVEIQVRGGGATMPSFNATLSDEQIGAVADYVTTQL